MKEIKDMNVFIYTNKKEDIDKKNFEVVETKGKGHQIIFVIH